MAVGQLHVAGDVAVVDIATADARHLQVATGLVDRERAGGDGLGPDRAGNALQGDVAGADAADAHIAIDLPGADITRAHGLDHQFPGLSATVALADGITIAVPNDATNEARALQLLASNGLIEIDPNAGLKATPNDITSNPKNLNTFK